MRLGSPCILVYNCFSIPYYSRCPILWAFDHGQMGLGKTLQAISLLSYLKIQRIAPGPFRAYTSLVAFFFYYIGRALITLLLLAFWSRKVTLAVVLCPLSVTEGWLSEFSKFCPSFRVLQYVGDKLHRRDLRRTIYEDVHKASTSSPFNVCSSITGDRILVQYSLRVSHDSHPYVWHLSFSLLSFFLLHATGITIWCAHDNIWHSLDGSRFSFTDPLALCSYWWSSTS